MHSPASGGGGGSGGGGSGAGGAAASPSAVLSPSRSLARAASSDGEMYDVFLSYRRLGGADFAQLLKLLLKGEGLNVFLDTENLGTGNFQEQLVTSLRRSKNVVLVWSKGCMDRFLDDADQTTADFVRLEYKHAISMAKNIIPCYKEDFSFPAAERVPADIRDVMSMNAVKWIGEVSTRSSAVAPRAASHHGPVLRACARAVPRRLAQEAHRRAAALRRLLFSASTPRRLRVTLCAELCANVCARRAAYALAPPRPPRRYLIGRNISSTSSHARSTAAPSRTRSSAPSLACTAKPPRGA